jgi:hypothetical protein
VNNQFKKSAICSLHIAYTSVGEKGIVIEVVRDASHIKEARFKITYAFSFMKRIGDFKDRKSIMFDMHINI